MKIFTGLYDRTLSWARHPHAERYLCILSFAESSFFPVPPDLLLVPMTLAKPASGWHFALLTTVASVGGGMLGYAIGWFLLDAIQPVLVSLGYWDEYLRATEWFLKWGFLAVLIAGFSPIPYKIFTIAAGALHMLLPVFVLASFVGRGGRFFLVAGLLRWGGGSMERKLRKHVDLIGWISIALVALLYVLLRLRS